MYEKLKSNDAPKRERRSTSLFESTPEWKALKADLDRGLRKKEQCRLQFTKADWKRIGLSGDPEPGRNTAVGCKSVRRFIQKYLREQDLPYAVRALHNGKYDYIIVGRPEE